MSFTEVLSMQTSMESEIVVEQPRPVKQHSSELLELLIRLSSNKFSETKLASDDTFVKQAEHFSKLMHVLFPKVKTQISKIVSCKELLTWQSLNPQNTNAFDTLQIIQVEYLSDAYASSSLLLLFETSSCDHGDLMPLIRCVEHYEQTIFNDLFDEKCLLFKPLKSTLCSIKQASSWSLQMHIQAMNLRSFDVRQFSRSMIELLDMPKSVGQQLYLVINELYSNAVEHGVLELNTKMKQIADGFTEYYQQRDRELEAIKFGYVNMAFKLTQTQNAHRLSVQVADSGAGFDYIVKQPSTDVQKVMSGRGTAIVQALCKDIQFHGNGSRVEVNYHW